VSGPFYGEGARGPCRFVAALSLSPSRLASIVAFGSSVGTGGHGAGLTSIPRNYLAERRRIDHPLGNGAREGTAVLLTERFWRRGSNFYICPD
jgi:hypothetical protein